MTLSLNLKNCHRLNFGLLHIIIVTETTPYFILWLKLRTLVAYNLHFQPGSWYQTLIGLQHITLSYSLFHFILDFSMQKSNAPLFSVLLLNHELLLELLLLKLKIHWTYECMCAAWFPWHFTIKVQCLPQNYS